MLKKNFFIFFVLAFVFLFKANAADSDTREFTEYKCKVSLPTGSKEFVWVDEAAVQNTVALMQEKSDSTLSMLIVKRLPSNVKIDNDEFDEGFCQKGKITKIAGYDTTINEVPCYEVHARMDATDKIIVAKVFYANQYVYIMQYLGPVIDKAKVPAQGEYDDCFPVFAFIGKPKLPGGTGDSISEILVMVGKIASYTIFGVAILGLARFGKKKK